MKWFSFIASIITLLVCLGYGFFYLPDFSSLDGVIYFGLMVILVLICITGIIINMPFYKKRTKSKNGYHHHHI